MNTWGQELRLSIFGESHGRAVGITVDGLPPGEEIDMEKVAGEMLRRAPGGSRYTTQRKEADTVEILSGLYEGKTTGFPVCGVIFNTDTRSGDYDTKLRPGHADWTALLKYGGNADMRGGGHFSGRLTAPLVFAGSLAKQVLARRGVFVFGRITRIGQVEDKGIPCDPKVWQMISGKPFPAVHETALQEEIMKAKTAGDSVGGIVEAVAFGLPGGLGEPFFGSMESAVSAMLFSVPAIKGVEFGDGFRLAALNGSQANDGLVLEDGEIRPLTNHNGGILGGITTGAPLIVRVAVKPTSSIPREQRTVDAGTMQPALIKVRGRHDPCIALRAVPVVEAAIALCALDRMLVARSVSI